MGIYEKILKNKFACSLQKYVVIAVSTVIILALSISTTYGKDDKTAGDSVKVQYKYMNEKTLTAYEKTLIKKDLTSIKASKDASYYIIYRDENMRNAVNTGDDFNVYPYVVVAGVCLVVALFLSKKGKKTILSVGMVFIFGGATYFYSVQALEASNISFTEEHEVKIGSNLPEPKVENKKYKIVGFIEDNKLQDKENLIENKLENKEGATENKLENSSENKSDKADDKDMKEDVSKEDVAKGEDEDNTAVVEDKKEDVQDEKGKDEDVKKDENIGKNTKDEDIGKDTSSEKTENPATKDETKEETKDENKDEPKGNWTTYKDNDVTKNILWANGIKPPKMGENGDFVKSIVATDYVDYEAKFAKDSGWYDTNKKGVDEDQSIDQSLCFAAVATNMMYWWQDQNKEEIEQFITYLENKGYFNNIEENSVKDIRYLFKSEGTQKNNAIYNMFTLYFFNKKSGYQTDILLDFYINGYKPKELGGTNSETQDFNYDDRAGFFNEVFANKKLTDRMFSGNVNSFSKLVKNTLENGSIAGLQYLTGRSSSHIVTLWGAEFDETEKVKAIYVTDSDDQDNADKLGMKRYLVREIDGRTAISTNEKNDRHGAKVEYLHILRSGKDMWKDFFNKQ